MKTLILTLTLAACCTVAAQAAGDPLTGLPIGPGYHRTADKLQTKPHCGRSATTAAYIGDETSPDDPVPWYSKALPSAQKLVSPSGITAFVVKDGTVGVLLAGSIINYVKFSPALSAAAVKNMASDPNGMGCP